jgi:ribosome-associated protein
MLKFELTRNSFIDLCDLLKILKLCDTGAAAKYAIAEGKVKVNGVVELRKRAKITTNQIVEFNGEQIKVI